jgi:cytochrome c oxidase subunit 2
MNRSIAIGLLVLPIVGCGHTASHVGAPEGAAAGTETRTRAGVDALDDVVHVTARRFEYAPARIVLKRGHPVDLELVSLDCRHGFSAPDLGVRADITPGQPTRLHVVPKDAGTFGFHCDVFCGDGHEDMSGEIVVVE